MRSMRSILLAACTWLASAASAQADFVYEFGLAGVSPTPVFTIDGSISTTVDVEVYLREDPGGTVLATEFLLGAVLRVTYDAPPGVAAVLNVADITPGPGLDAGGSSVSGTEAILNLLDTAGPVDVGPDGLNRILLATLRFTGLADGTVTIIALDNDPSLDDVLTGLGNVLDPDIATGTATIDVTNLNQVVIPEPATLTLAALGCLAMVGYVRRRS